MLLIRDVEMSDWLLGKVIWKTDRSQAVLSTSHGVTSRFTLFVLFR